MSDIPTLIATIENDRALALEVLRKLPALVNTTALVQFDLDTPVEVPSIPMFQKELSAGNLGTRVGNLETLSRGLIQEVDDISSEVGLDRVNPFWSPLLLENDGDGDRTEILFRAEVEDGIRMPFDGYYEIFVDRQFETDAARLGNWMLPNHTEDTDARFTSPPNYNEVVDANSYPLTTGTRTRTRSYTRRSYRVGHYYRWLRWRRRKRRIVVTRSYSVTTVEPVTSALEGSMIGQTFRVDEARILTGLDIYLDRPGTYAPAANARVILCETAYGRPDLDQMVAQGTFRENAALTYTTSSSSRNQQLCNVDLDRPVLLEAEKSYAFVIVADAAFHVGRLGNVDKTGSLFYTQDAAAWDQNLSQDIAYQLRFAVFEGPTETINISPMSLSGGIASIKQDLLAVVPEGGDIRTEFELGGTWLSVEDVEELNSLPAHTPMRLVLSGSEKVMPLIDVTGSKVIGLRPASQMQFYSKERPEAQEVRVSYELVGFVDIYHTFDPGLKVGGTRYTPSLVEHKDSADGNVRSLTAVFELPTVLAYQHDIKASTTTAAKVFDISSIIELNT
ncbi:MULTISPECIES: hypothetical protein [Phaeobacter]|uniref:hypothetical protein n=1 Tax=Phaeobacter TaxID=302485 RepID=UPI00058E2CF7|nr:MULTISPECIES: hypothetical protein [Phaeobacter]KII14119.1 hypothetical protein OO25_13930 [Phaeobacter sp. S60]UTS80937.1 hypothetical protein OL67_002008 [Phaeobacter piscinae]